MAPKISVKDNIMQKKKKKEKKGGRGKKSIEKVIQIMKGNMGYL